MVHLDPSTDQTKNDSWRWIYGEITAIWDVISHTMQRGILFWNFPTTRHPWTSNFQPLKATLNFWRKGISYTVQEVCCTLLKRYIVHCYFPKPNILRLPQYLWQQTTTSDSHLSVEVKVWRYKSDTGFTAVKSNVLQWPWYQRKVHYTLTSTRVLAENGINWQWTCRWRKLCGAPSFRTNQVTTGARFESVNWDAHNSLWHLCIM